ncbi:alkylhydroperoxidase domain protein [Nonomuraea sp. H19]|uniref:alkylhydroperoxidase domain protein n=1 Tax=Nonomuraea sp. H19 TaxID=3452206 RepID=UPI003F8C9E37
MSGFTREQLGWEPWLAPLTADELTDEHYEALVDKARAKSPYFLLLARDPDILHARTKTDVDIFYNPDGGLPRAERELAATATSRRNGCVFCASVHARFAAHYAKRPDDVQRLLDEGVDAPQDGTWRAVIDAAVALAATPADFGPEHVAALRAAGLDDLAISDTIHAAAFFNWANRLMLSLGEPTREADQ